MHNACVLPVGLCSSPLTWPTIPTGDVCLKRVALGGYALLCSCACAVCSRLLFYACTMRLPLVYEMCFAISSVASFRFHHFVRCTRFRCPVASGIELCSMCGAQSESASRLRLSPVPGHGCLCGVPCGVPSPSPGGHVSVQAGRRGDRVQPAAGEAARRGLGEFCRRWGCAADLVCGLPGLIPLQRRRERLGSTTHWRLGVLDRVSVSGTGFDTGCLVAGT